jgi:hypothetical protein
MRLKTQNVYAPLYRRIYAAGFCARPPGLWGAVSTGGSGAPTIGVTCEPEGTVTLLDWTCGIRHPRVARDQGFSHLLA